ncbi:alpha/beta hydrolase [Kitasatospora sp. MAP5-34]|uniref:alpha/beta fold hydrolase n=1 Tax=Kitasatospora sp. MAP5-34 TaxID=3035102 RepID=UPI0024754ACE|nr:alpha/beta hydrolase [Kitasatospora sp. MAP5-34]MDH6576028.1 pimeloyl-ACP methyl ester carboxylesterase [Kitasatospora sp. MAP5-34]
MTEDLARFHAAYDAVLDRWPVPVDRIDLPSAYGTTRVTACGPVDGEPLVLLHGGDTSSPVWFANVADLSRTRRVYAVDRIGAPGRSVRGDRPVRSVDDLLDWLDGVLDGLGLARTDLCGHSYGAWIALTYALRAPQRVRRLVLLDPTQCFAGFRPGYLLRALPMLLRPTAGRARAFLAWETRGAEADPGWLELYGLAAEFPRAKVVVGRRPEPGQLRQSTVPTLVLLAGESRVHNARRVEAAVRRRAPHAGTAVLPGLSHHGMPYTGGAALDRMILDFLAIN